MHPVQSMPRVVLLARVRGLLGLTVIWPVLAVGGEGRPSAGLQDTGPPKPYHVIAQRNAFGLRPQPPPSTTSSQLEPQEDLLLTGVIDIASCHQALFMLAAPGKPPSFFNIREGEQNEWMEVKSVNTRAGTVKALLKKPVARERNIGVEVVLSFKADGLKNRTVALNRGNPHVDTAAY